MKIKKYALVNKDFGINVNTSMTHPCSSFCARRNAIERSKRTIEPTEPIRIPWNQLSRYAAIPKQVYRIAIRSPRAIFSLFISLALCIQEGEITARCLKQDAGAIAWFHFCYTRYLFAIMLYKYNHMASIIQLAILRTSTFIVHFEYFLSSYIYMWTITVRRLFSEQPDP